MNDKGSAITVVVPAKEEEIVEETITPFAYVFSGTARKLAEALKWENLSEVKEWISDYAPRVVDPEDIESPIAPIGEIYIKEEEGQVVRIKRNKNGQRQRVEKRRFSFEVIDNNATIAAMAMELVD